MKNPEFDPAEARALSDLIREVIGDLRRQGFSESAIMAGSLSCAVSIIATNHGPEFAACMCEKAADELRGVGHA